MISHAPFEYDFGIIELKHLAVIKEGRKIPEGELNS